MEKDEQCNLRLPKDLKEWLKTQAATARRTLTSEVIFRLERSREQESQPQKGQQ